MIPRIQNTLAKTWRLWRRFCGRWLDAVLALATAACQKDSNPRAPPWPYCLRLFRDNLLSNAWIDLRRSKKALLFLLTINRWNSIAHKGQQQVVFTASIGHRQEILIKVDNNHTCLNLIGYSSKNGLDNTSLELRYRYIEHPFDSKCVVRLP